MSEWVVINDVGPRDGLQNQSKVLEPGQRLELIESLLAAGVRHIEVGAFVSPRAVPAMAGADRVIAGLPQVAGADYSVLIPNLKGYELATAAGARHVAMVLYGSDGMARKNVNMSLQQAEEATTAILERARTDGVRVAATIAVAFECPFDGPTDPDVVARIAADFLAQGVDEFVIADTIGAANPAQVRGLMDRLVEDHGPERLACHFHDTRAMGLANVFAALESGVRRFDASIGGLGGCPFAPGATGNVATEDVVMMLEQMGFATGIDLAALVDAAERARELTGTAPGGRSMAWLKRHLERRAAA
ncbi:hydroxymethylglutaryl-CoA lyase [Elongatibacter sediminis]|uniref:Hydroxymethylglutaryl-CoA lyase n=1 Tax=Elongatibacter sediminis TaxID=3119006 RepID=A0AAW9RIE8_9GAMM